MQHDIIERIVRHVRVRSHFHADAYVQEAIIQIVLFPISSHTLDASLESFVDLGFQTDRIVKQLIHLIKKLVNVLFIASSG